MDMSLVLSALTAQSSNFQTSVATQVIKNNPSSEKQAVQILLGTGGASQANLGAGVGGQVDRSA